MLAACPPSAGPPAVSCAVQVRLFGYVADPALIGDRILADGSSVQAHRPLSNQQPDHHVHGRALARPVRPEIAEDLAALDGEVHRSTARNAPVPLRQLARLQHSLSVCAGCRARGAAAEPLREDDRAGDHETTQAVSKIRMTSSRSLGLT